MGRQTETTAGREGQGHEEIVWRELVPEARAFDSVDVVVVLPAVAFQASLCDSTVRIRGFQGACAPSVEPVAVAAAVAPFPVGFESAASVGSSGH